MRMYGIDLAGLAWKDDSQLTKSDAALRGRNLTERLQELGLSYVQDVVSGKEYAGILPMFPWENAKVSRDITTMGNAKRFVARQLMKVCNDELDDLKARIGYIDNINE
ncbi:MAG: hypothetical protein IJ849_08940 [Selenomonadaceae bacterium]|nr:hypothetical protein [Selenomonadaceae bacterium]